MTWQPGDPLYDGPGEGVTRPMFEVMDDLKRWKCPNDPPCLHPKMLHDIEEYDGDGTDTCCVDECECRGPNA